MPRHPSALLLVLLVGVAPLPASGATEADLAQARQAMIVEVREMALEARAATPRGTLSEQVLAAMVRVPRHRFVPEERIANAYDNRPLPIGYGQTISQPYIVALMTDLLQVSPGDRVFELGTGSGYQAAVLAELGCQVWTMEIVEPLGELAAARFAELGYDHIQSRVGDAYHGWAAFAPYDAIVVTAAGDHIPPPLIDQLRPGGRMIIPVGDSFLTQQLLLVEKGADGGISTRAILPVSFVPITGGH